MKEPTPDPADAVDDLVASYLHHEESRTDAASLHERIEADRRLDSTLHLDHKITSRRTTLRRAAWWSTMAGVVLAAFLGGRYFDPASANAATLLRNVKTVHTQSVDRCYRVLFALDLESENGVEAPSGAWESLLWTRGDSFFSGCAIGKTRLTVGRDEAGNVWLAPSRQKGIRFSPEKTDFPKEVETICQINSMTVPILVDDVLADFNLETDGPSTQADGSRSVVWARLKPGRTHAFLSAATLEIDAETDVLVRLVLWLHKKDQGPNGTVTYTLINQPAPGDVSYQLESHLDAGAMIEDHSFQPKK